MKLIADDYAFNQACSDGILTLLDQGVIDGTSCMTCADHWAEHGERLKHLRQSNDRFEVGLHLTLTEPSMSPLTLEKFPNLKSALLKSFSPLTDKSWNRAIYDEFFAQWQAFETVMGQPPDFIDGHQHVHILPQVRKVTFELLANKTFQGWVRSCSPQFKGFFARPFKIKSAALTAFGLGFRSQLRSRNIKTNSDFAGVYDFNPARFETAFNTWRQTCDIEGVAMCHPAKPSEHRGILSRLEDSDPIAAARHNEFKVLAKARLGS